MICFYFAKIEKEITMKGEEKSVTHQLPFLMTPLFEENNLKPQIILWKNIFIFRKNTCQNSIYTETWDIFKQLDKALCALEGDSKKSKRVGFSGLWETINEP